MVDVRQRVSWRAVAAAVVLFAVLLLNMPREPAGAGPGDGQVAVIVREAAGAGSAPEALVQRLGGTVGRQLRIIGGFAAIVPPRHLGACGPAGPCIR